MSANFWEQDEIVSPAPAAPAPTAAPAVQAATVAPTVQAIGAAPPGTPAAAAPATGPAPVDAPAAPMASQPATKNFWDDDEIVAPAATTAPAAPAAPATAPADTKPERSMLGELGHQAGLFARGAVNAATALPAMAADAVTAPINAGLDLVNGKGNGFRFQPQAQAVNNFMDSVGVAKPENATERVSQDVMSAVGGAGGTMALGKALTASGGPLSKAVGAMLTSNPVLQTTSAAASGGASGTVRELGGGEGAQLAAGVAGALLPGAMRAPFGKAVDPSRNRLAASARQANEAGYVVPAADLSDGPVAQLASAVSGKVKTAQEASYRNQSNSNRLAKEALGMQPEQALDMDSLAALRNDASKAYAPVANAGMVVPTKTYSDALDDAVSVFKSQARSFPDAPVPPVVKHIEALKSGQFDAGDGLNMIKVLRGNADTAFRAGDKLAGASYKKAAGAIEGALEDHLVSLGAPAADVLKQYRDARQLIAKSYDVQGALNPTTGNVNAIQLAAKLRKGRPLTDELRTIAEVSQAFPKATETLKQAPGQNSVLDVAGSLVGLTATGSPLSLLTLGARPAVRNAILSEIAQKRLVKGAGLKSQPIPDGKMAIGLGEALRANQRQEEPPPYVELRGMADKPMNRLQAGRQAFKNGGVVEKVEGGFVVRSAPGAPV